MTQASELSYSGDFLTAFANWRARFTVLLAHFLTARFRGSKFGIIFTLLEPLLWCWGLVLLRTLFRNTQPNYGTSLVLFYASGMFPFFLFMRISRRAVRVTTNPVQRPAQITILDMYLANALVETLIWTSIVILLFCGMYLYGIEQALPRSMSDTAASLSLLIIFGFGIGLVNAAIARFFQMWTFVYAMGSRILMFGSGALAVVAMLPVQIRNIVVWNPVAHGVEWFRVVIYGFYPDDIIDRPYLAKSALVAVFIGIVADRAFVRFARR